MAKLVLKTHTCTADSLINHNAYVQNNKYVHTYAEIRIKIRIYIFGKLLSFFSGSRSKTLKISSNCTNKFIRRHIGSRYI